MSDRNKQSVTAGTILAERFGPREFWAEVGELHKTCESGSYLSWEERDRFFLIARRHGMTQYWYDENGQPGEPKNPIARAIYKTYCRVQEAKNEGLSAYQFHLREVKSNLSVAERNRLEDEAERTRAAERREANRTKPGGNTTRTFTPRPADAEAVTV